MGQAGEPTVDPGGLTTAQLLGDACVVCRKKWPRPRVRVGRLPDSTGVFACDECAPAPPAPRTRRGHPGAGHGRREAGRGTAAGEDDGAGRRRRGGLSREKGDPGVRGEARDHPTGAPGWGRPGAPERPFLTAFPRTASLESAS